MTTNNQPHVTIYTDGGAKPNPGPGGYGVLIRHADYVEELSGAEHDTTNNQMELMAAIVALESLEQSSSIDFYTDSIYVKNGITSWIKKWLKSNWLNSKKQPVANQELWQRLHDAIQRHDINWRWVKGHDGDPDNERVDQLATEARCALTGEALTVAETDNTPSKPIPQGVPWAYLKAVYDHKRNKGAWAVIIADDEEERQITRPAHGMTQNQMTLEAAIQLLESVKPDEAIAVFTDSEYLQKGMSEWIEGWIKRGWQTSSKKPVKNSRQWKQLNALAQARNVTWHYTSDDDDYLHRAGIVAETTMNG